MKTIAEGEEAEPPFVMPVNFNIAGVSVSAINLDFLIPRKSYDLIIQIFNLNCPKEGWKFDYSVDIMHASTQYSLIAEPWNI